MTDPRVQTSVKAFQWRSFTWENTYVIPSFVQGAGVYAIYLDGDLVYIGSSENLRSRVRQHGRGFHGNIFTTKLETQFGNCNRVTFKIKLARRFGEWPMREMRLIRRLKPCGNSRGVWSQWRVSGGE